MAHGLGWRLWHAWDEDLTMGEPGEGEGERREEERGGRGGEERSRKEKGGDGREGGGGEGRRGEALFLCISYLYVCTSVCTSVCLSVFMSVYPLQHCGGCRAQSLFLPPRQAATRWGMGRGLCRELHELHLITHTVQVAAHCMCMYCGHAQLLPCPTPCSLVRRGGTLTPTHHNTSTPAGLSLD